MCALCAACACIANVRKPALMKRVCDYASLITSDNLSYDVYLREHTTHKHRHPLTLGAVVVHGPQARRSRPAGAKRSGSRAASTSLRASRKREREAGAVQLPSLFPNNDTKGATVISHCAQMCGKPAYATLIDSYATGGNSCACKDCVL